MEIKTGIDIIEVNRIKESIEKLGDKFLNKIYTPLEIEYCSSKNKVKYQHFAARFAAKEAIFKALSDSLENKYEINWLDIEIVNAENGKPKVHFINKKFDINQIDISISHLEEYAVASCILIKGV